MGDRRTGLDEELFRALLRQGIPPAEARRRATLPSGDVDWALYQALLQNGKPTNTALRLATIPGVRNLDQNTAAILYNLPTDESGRRLRFGLGGTDLQAGTDLLDVVLSNEALENYESLQGRWQTATDEERTDLEATLDRYADVLGLDTSAGYPQYLPEAMFDEDFRADTMLYQSGMGISSLGPQTTQARMWEFTPAGREGLTPQQRGVEGPATEQHQQAFMEWVRQQAAAIGTSPRQWIKDQEATGWKAPEWVSGRLEGVERPEQRFTAAQVEQARMPAFEREQARLREGGITFGAFSQNVPQGSVRQRQFFKSLFDDVAQAYRQSPIVRRVDDATAAAGQFGRFVQGWDFESRWAQLSEAERGIRTRQFRPTLRTLRR
jgi:hypothetical protein